MALPKRLAELAQQREPGLGYTDLHDAPIVRGPSAVDQSALLELVEKPGDVRRTRHEPAGQVQRSDHAGVGACQKAQGVVLLRREVISAKECLFEGAQAIVGPPQAEEDLLLQGIEMPARPSPSRCHAVQDKQSDNSCPDNFALCEEFMPKQWRVASIAGPWTVLVLGALAAQDPPAARITALRFEVTVAKGLLAEPTDGRVLVALSRTMKAEPRLGIGHYGLDSSPLLGADAQAFAPGATVVLDQTSAIFPVSHLSRLPAGEYAVQAVLHHNRDLNLVGAPGNLYSAAQTLVIDPAKGGIVKLELTKAVPPEQLLADTEHVRYLKLRSEVLSQFHGRPIYLRAGLILPRDFTTEKDRRYPLRVHIGGYGSRFTGVGDMMNALSGFRKVWLADDTPRMLFLHLDGAGPFGDPYQVNSANNGPYGDAITRELIPYVEKHYRGIGEGTARFLDGGSTGGWVSLALQAFYPDFFNGAWSRAPDPVDFRAYELIDIYKDENAYLNVHGFERPSSRDLSGDVRTTVRHECQLERVLGRGDRWELSGKDWCAWNATFGPRGEDGRPRPFWDGKTGKLDRSVVEHWKQYDLRMVMEKQWPTLGPKLRGKLHIWVGEADEYYLNNAVHLLDDFLKKAKPAYEGTIVYGMGQGHSWDGLGESERVHAMAKAMAK
jgi:hypothetical protein